jgi:hypothetical protein
VQSEPKTRLVVQGDDFGMCHAVNTGTVRAFTDGIVTQASTMVPCPWFTEAAALAGEHGLPLGMHATLTCEWDFLRWGPLTAGSTLRDASAATTLVRTVPLAKQIASEEATAELVAQAERFLATGRPLTYVDVHMGMSQLDAYEAITRRFGVPFIYPGVSTSLAFDSIKTLSNRPSETKKDWLLGYLERRTPGVHLLVSHCADDEPELAAITRADAPDAPWAREYRVSDLAVLTDVDERDAVDRLGIELVSVAAAFS